MSVDHVVIAADDVNSSSVMQSALVSSSNLLAVRVVATTCYTVNGNYDDERILTQRVVEIPMQKYGLLPKDKLIKSEVDQGLQSIEQIDAVRALLFKI